MQIMYSLFVFSYSSQVWKCHRCRCFPAGPVGQSVSSWRSSPRAVLPTSPNRVDHSNTHSYPSHTYSSARSWAAGSRRRRWQWIPGSQWLQWADLPTAGVSWAGKRGSDVGLQQATCAHGGTPADPCQWWTFKYLQGQSTASQWVYIFIAQIQCH